MSASLQSLLRTPKVRLFLRAAWAVWIAIVAIGSLLPGESAPMVALASFQINDKVQHFLSYAALAFLPALHERRRALAFIAPGLVAFGILLEFGQLFSPGRDFELGDMAADAAGVAAGLLLGLLLRPKPDTL